MPSNVNKRLTVLEHSSIQRRRMDFSGISVEEIERAEAIVRRYTGKPMRRLYTEFEKTCPAIAAQVRSVYL